MRSDVEVRPSALRVPRKPTETLHVAPGRGTFLVRTPEGVTDCRPAGTQLWKLEADVRAGQGYAMEAEARVFSVKVDASGSACAASASIDSVTLQDKSNGRTVASAEKISDADLARLMSGQPPPIAAVPAATSDSARSTAPPSSSSTPEAPLAATQVSLVDFGRAEAPGRARAKTSGAVVRVDVRSPGRVHLRAADAAAVAADGSRVPAKLGFAIETANEVSVVMLEDTTIEGMTIHINDKRYEAYSSMPRMAAHLEGVAGWAYDTAAGNALTLGVLFDCPSDQIRELEVLGSRLAVSPGGGDTISESGRPARELTILGANHGPKLKVRRGKRPPFVAREEPAPKGNQWLTVAVELSTSDSNPQLPLRDIALTGAAGRSHELSCFGDSADDAAFISVDDVTRESVSVFLNEKGEALYAVYPASGGPTLGFIQSDGAASLPHLAPRKIRLALAFAVPRAERRFRLEMGGAAPVEVVAGGRANTRKP